MLDAVHALKRSENISRDFHVNKLRDFVRASDSVINVIKAQDELKRLGSLMCVARVRRVVHPIAWIACLTCDVRHRRDSATTCCSATAAWLAKIECVARRRRRAGGG